MSFSIDYEFEGTPDKTDYFWIIERSQGVSARIPVKLENQGTLVTLIQKWRPSEGPFEAHIEDKNGKHISHSVELFGQN